MLAAASYFGGWDSLPGEPATTIAMGFPVEGWKTSAAVVLRQSKRGAVTGEVYGAGREAERAWRQALAVVSLDADGTGFAAVGKRDPVIGELQSRYPGVRPVLFHSPYEAACGFLIGHRISIAQGRAIRRRMAAELGAQVATPHGVVSAFPTPQRLLEVDAVAGVPEAKIPRLHAAAQAALDGVLDRESLRALPLEDALARVKSIPGIGPFFALGIVIRGAGTVDELSGDDVTLQAVKAAYKMCSLPSPGGMRELSDAWRPYRTWVNVLLHVWFRRDGGGPVRGRRG